MQIIDLFNRLITKNQNEPKSRYLEEIRDYYDATVSNIDDKKPESKAALLKQLDDWAKGAAFDKSPIEAKYLNEPFATMILSAIRLEAYNWLQRQDDERDRALCARVGTFSEEK